MISYDHQDRCTGRFHEDDGMNNNNDGFGDKFGCTGRLSIKLSNNFLKTMCRIIMIMMVLVMNLDALAYYPLSFQIIS